MGPGSVAIDTRVMGFNRLRIPSNGELTQAAAVRLLTGKLQAGVSNRRAAAGRICHALAHVL